MWVRLSRPVEPYKPRSITERRREGVAVGLGSFQINIAEKKFDREAGMFPPKASETDRHKEVSLKTHFVVFFLILTKKYIAYKHIKSMIRHAFIRKGKKPFLCTQVYLCTNTRVQINMHSQIFEKLKVKNYVTVIRSPDLIMNRLDHRYFLKSCTPFRAPPQNEEL